MIFVYRVFGYSFFFFDFSRKFDNKKNFVRYFFTAKVVKIMLGKSHFLFFFQGALQSQQPLPLLEVTRCRAPACSSTHLQSLKLSASMGANAHNPFLEKKKVWHLLFISHFLHFNSHFFIWHALPNTFVTFLFLFLFLLKNGQKNTTKHPIK